jgi:hypothetical protein
MAFYIIMCYLTMKQHAKLDIKTKITTMFYMFNNIFTS